MTVIVLRENPYVGFAYLHPTRAFPFGLFQINAVNFKPWQIVGLLKEIRQELKAGN
jgi:hypothetical protein